jgi:hypothetical protein
MQISGTFVYQPQTIIPNRLNEVGEESYPGAVAVALVILNDDGSPAFASGSNPYVTCQVVLSMPFVPGSTYSLGIGLAQADTVEVQNDGLGYVGLTYMVPSDVTAGLPAGWTPMAILATVSLENDALLTAAPVPTHDMGILPPVSTGGIGPPVGSGIDSDGETME